MGWRVKGRTAGGRVANNHNDNYVYNVHYTCSIHNYFGQPTRHSTGLSNLFSRKGEHSPLKN